MRARARKTAAAACAACLAGLVVSSRAAAQVHWDASAEVGAMKRNLSSRPASGTDAGFGPVGELGAHLALLPLVRVGAYLGHDISPRGDASARDLTWAGLRAKIMSPWPRGDVRAWVFVGFGYAGVYQRSTSGPRDLTVPGGAPARADATIQGAGGSFFEVPFGIGASYKLRKPWELAAELGGTAGFGFHGSMYGAPGPQVSSPGRADGNVPPAGKDSFGISLVVGVLVDL